MSLVFKSNPFGPNDWARLDEEPFAALDRDPDQVVVAGNDTVWMSEVKHAFDGSLKILLHQLSLGHLNHPTLTIRVNGCLEATYQTSQLVAKVFKERVASVERLQNQPLFDTRTTANSMKKICDEALERFCCNRNKALTQKLTLLEERAAQLPTAIKAEGTDHITYARMNNDDYFPRDVEMRCQGQVIKVHSQILIGRSGEGLLRAAEQGEITSLDAETLQALVQCFYTDVLDIAPLSAKQKINLYRFASTYQLEKVREFCHPHVAPALWTKAGAEQEVKINREREALVRPFEPNENVDLDDLVTFFTNYTTFVQEASRETLSVLKEAQLLPPPVVEVTEPEAAPVEEAVVESPLSNEYYVF